MFHAKIPNPPEASTQLNEQVFNYYNWRSVIPESNPKAFLAPVCETFCVYLTIVLLWLAFVVFPLL